MFPRIGMTFAVLLLVAGCASMPDGPPEPDGVEVQLNGDRIVYRGSMSGEAIDKVGHLLERADGRIAWLDIESGGGEVNWGLDLGNLVHEHGLHVRVIGAGCHSSCANYVFTAADRRVIEPGAVVSWHGSALQRRWGFRARVLMTISSEARDYFVQWQQRQEEFFERIEVDPRVTIVGQDLGCRCTWALSVEDMALFGLTNIEAPESYTSTDLSGFPERYRFRFLDLPEDVFERIRERGDA